MRLIKFLPLIKFFANIQSSPSFDKASDFFEKISSAMIHEVFQKDDVIFHFGDFGKKLYLILTGSVTFYVPKTQIELKEEVNNILEKSSNDRELIPYSTRKTIEKIKKSDSKNELKPIIKIENNTIPKNEDRKFLGTNSQLPLTLEDEDLVIRNVDVKTVELFTKLEHNTNISYIENGICKMKKVKTLVPGDIFGDYALTLNRPRTATVIASEELQVITLNKKDYISILKDKSEKEYGKLQFFRQFFPNFSKETLTKFCFEFTEKKFKYSEVLYSQGEEPLEFYIIRQGEVQVINLINNHILN